MKNDEENLDIKSEDEFEDNDNCNIEGKTFFI